MAENTALETIEVHPITFPPDVLARISPELSLQRHLSLGIRPCLRRYEEFRDITIENNTLSRYVEKDSVDAKNNILGSNILKSGKTVVITSITGGIIEENSASIKDLDDFGEDELYEVTKEEDEIANYASIYPVVEVERGRVGACTDEEMTISQKLYDSVLHSRILPKKALKVKAGVRSVNEDGTFSVLYPDELENDALNETNLKMKRKWSYVLYAKIIVLSRTGPVFDLCWNSLMYALQNVKLPKAFIDERASDLRMTIRTRGRSATIRETYEILCDQTKSLPLMISSQNIAFAANYGVIELDPESQLQNPDNAQEEVDIDMDKSQCILIADLDTEAEEISIHSTISVIASSAGRYKQLTLVGAGAKITPEMIKRSLLLSKVRANDLSARVKK
ncbi:exosome non-catalytic core subunit RRP43 SKDI_03G1020 [Saccharomyces kudriavzevii IFO 1802]|uniref:Uncharacterized protein n=2 Tax=Saccharomyces kudriavzevii (strain ATCC MYA-4449 / AS 2.2408 / CBS 8840 / NBRC 1802 / NCYC 2889) TaxID=226230 RepID=A0AA35JC97_SACK1|nr:uncharacterized protein SKDI_03G1020 [Saccharomyces kudriavzevii IFO 1802]EJT43933.1 RRP43-like protein [Saccharomyces kudriavzevii IFO 1802]CAI4056701.1 hypothetical protein SKDI_03G1020 [Saccharomyces kudriavzevii IFO 1802]